jgi:hypothetical protein
MMAHQTETRWEKSDGKLHKEEQIPPVKARQGRTGAHPDGADRRPGACFRGLDTGRDLAHTCAIDGRLLELDING